jgi:hypothetical protein
MRRQHPNHEMDIPISLAVWYQLIDGCVKSGYQKEEWEIAAEAIDEWMRRHNPDAIPIPAAAGYQWKSQFLPAGTLLRTVFGGKNYHCIVESDQILYNGKPVSPSGFVNAVGGIRRNAWRSIWILFPDTKDWKLADTLRTPTRPRRARKPAGEMLQAAVTAPCTARAPAAVPPVAAPSPQHIKRITAKASEAPNLQQAIDEKTPRTEPTGERRSWQQRRDISGSPPGVVHGMARRLDGDDRISSMLRQELLPLLYRMCACDGMAPSSQSALRT